MWPFSLDIYLGTLSKIFKLLNMLFNAAIVGLILKIFLYHQEKKKSGIFTKKWKGSRLSYCAVYVSDYTGAEKLVPDTSWAWCNLGTNRKTENYSSEYFSIHFTYILSFAFTVHSFQYKQTLYATVRWNWNSFGKLPPWLWRKHIIYTSATCKYI